jgi:SynChlorMet cassette radical SAM/SPASM protein ScmE
MSIMRVMRSPKSLDIDITSKCNLRCLYCSYFTSPQDVSQDLPGEEWLRFFEELGRCCVMDVTLQGGEPFCRKDISEIIEGIVQNRMRFSILTNGTLITDELAGFIASTKRCNHVQVSIDGSTPVAHDFCRGEGNFQRAMDGMKHLMDHGINTTVRVTIHKGNVNDLENIARLLLEDIGLPSFSTNSASFMGLCRKNSEIVQLTPAERSLAMDTLLRLSDKYPRRISATAGPQSEGKSWGLMERARIEGKPPAYGEGYLSACNGPMSKLAVRPDGVIIPCIQISHIELGRINKDSLLEVWQNHPELMRLRQRGIISLEGFEFCKGCEYIKYCNGSCPATAYSYFGDVYHPSPDACLKRFLDNGGRLPVSLKTSAK